MMKILFLDIDGVLCNLASQQGKHGRNYLKMPLPAPECVTALKHIIEATSPTIVVSSTWRLPNLTARLNTLRWLRAAGIKGPVGFTRDLSRQQGELHVAVERGREIADWVNRRPVPACFVILDDGNDMGELSDHLVRTNPQTGLTMQDAERAIDLLMQREPA